MTEAPEQTEAEVDAVLAEFAGDARAAMPTAPSLSRTAMSEDAA